MNAIVYPLGVVGDGTAAAGPGVICARRLPEGARIFSF